MPPVKFHGKAGKVKKGTLKRLLKILFTKFKWQLLLAAICIVFNVISNLSGTIVLKNVTDVLEKGIRNLTPTDNPLTVMNDVWIWIIFLGVTYFLGIFASYIWNVTMAIVTQKYLNTLRIQIFDHMETLPIKYFDQNAHGDIMSIYTNDVDTIRQMVSQSFPSLFMASIAVLFVVSTMVYYSIWFTLIVILGTIFMFLTAKILGGRSSKYYVKQQRSLGKVEASIEESINGLKVIKVFSHEEKSTEEFKELNDQLCKDATTANIAGNIMMPIIGNIGNLLYIVLTIVGSIFLMLGVTNVGLIGIEPLSISIVLAFLNMTRMFTNNVSNFSQQITFIMMGLAGASRIFAILDEPSEVDNGYVTLVNVTKDENGNLVETSGHTHLWAWKHPHGDGSVTYTELKGDIVLDHVDFGYVEDKLVLKDVSIYAHPGQKIAFVGATGAGKTTITNLINRFYDIQDGKIRYDGININKIKKADLRHSLGIVLQDTNLFYGTVRDNIRYGRLDASEEEIIEAAKRANAYDFIMRLPDGFDTMLSGDGANLSQGQRQLLSIARAACADAPVMILDEATSSIDTRTEKLVQNGMDELMKGRTVFVIAHRLSTVHDSDAIMVLDHGKIIERGNHQDLIDLKGVYYQLYTGAFELE
ncbi:MAG: ABC transporter ATP-binding protein [Bacilli bacterium]